MNELALPILVGQGQGGNEAASAVMAVLGLLFMLFYFAVIILSIAGLWKTFVKAGKPGWAAIIPIYNVIVLLEIVKRPLWWVVLFLIPFVNMIIAIVVCLDVAKWYGRGPGFGIGLAFLGFIFFPILGFGSAQYLGNGQPAGVTPGYTPQPL